MVQTPNTLCRAQDGSLSETSMLKTHPKSQLNPQDSTNKQNESKDPIDLELCRTYKVEGQQAKRRLPDKALYCIFRPLDHTFCKCLNIVEIASKIGPIISYRICILAAYVNFNP